MEKILLILLVFGASLLLFSENVYSEQSNGIVSAIEQSPYYFAENDFGINILRYYEAPLTPYLTPEVTEESSNKEIMDAYYKANAAFVDISIEQHSDRAISYVLHVESPEIFEDVTSFNFQLFNPATNPYEFTLESLASKDKQGYYEFVSRYINPGKRPDPFDATIDVVTGDGTVLQKWRYHGCKIEYFETYLQNNLAFIMFTGGSQSEIRDHSAVKCRARYMLADMDEIFNPYVHFKGPAKTKVYPTLQLGKIPSTDDRAVSFLVSFVGSEIPEEVTFQTFQQFGPLGQTIPQYYPMSGGLELNPQFYLESLLSKDKKGYYEYFSRYVTAAKIPEPFDVKIDLVTGDGTALLRWEYFGCEVTNFQTYLQDSVLAIKFHPGSTPEIRDHTEFECRGFRLEADFEVLFSPYHNLPKTGEKRLVAAEPGAIIPKDEDRAMSYVVHFADGDFFTPKTIRTYSKFQPNEITEFYLESLPSQDKNDIYDILISHSLNPGRLPAPFSVTVDLVAGDETILQKWKYYQCKVTNYQTELNDNLLDFRYIGKNVAEIRDKTSFECQGQDLVADPLKPVSPFTSIDVASPTLNPTSEPSGAAPSDEKRAISYVVRLIGEEIPQEETLSTFSKFATHGITVPSSGGYLIYNKEKPAFVLESLPSKDKEKLYELLSMYLNPGKSPEPFDVAVDIISGDNTILQTWQYVDCDIVNYETFLQDVLIIIKYNPIPVPEIRDKTGFVCEGFHFETPRLKAFSPYASIGKYEEQTELSDEQGPVVPSNNDRPMSYVVHLSGGEIIIPHTWLTISKYKQLSKTEFQLESLPSRDKKQFYDLFIQRYINPGQKPELFDVRIDLLTGDGTILQSWQHSSCQITDYVTFRSDNLASMRFSKTFNSEIRDRTTFDCAGLNIDIDGKHPLSQYIDIFKGLEEEPDVPQIIVPPHQQHKSGLSVNEIVCQRQMELMVRPDSSKPYCVKANSLTALQAKGWEIIGTKKSELTFKTQEAQKANAALLQGSILPTMGERASSYEVFAIGRELPELITNSKFSKFAPFTDGDITIPTAQILGIPIPTTATIKLSGTATVGNETMSYSVVIPVEDVLPIPTATIPGDTSTPFGIIPQYDFGDKPGFYLESLPAKDKSKLYQWVSRYVNPGKTPDPIDVGVVISDGDGNPLQTWVYRNCTVISYQIFLEENILMLKYHEQWGSEIKDRVMFSCNGLHLNEI